MKTVNNTYSTLQKNVKKWQTKYVTGEVDWEFADLAIRTLIVQYQFTLTAEALRKEIVGEGVNFYDL